MYISRDYIVKNMSEFETKTYNQDEADITLISSEGVQEINLNKPCSDANKFEINRKIIRMSKLIEEMVEDDDDVIHLPNVKSDVLEKVVKFCNYYFVNPMPEIAKPLQSATMKDCVGEWYANFINSIAAPAVISHLCKHTCGGNAQTTEYEIDGNPNPNIENEMVYKLMQAADFMQLEPLLQLIDVKVASMLIGKTSTEIQTFCQLSDNGNDNWTERDYITIKKEDKYCTLKEDNKKEPNKKKQEGETKT